MSELFSRYESGLQFTAGTMTGSVMGVSGINPIIDRLNSITQDDSALSGTSLIIDASGLTIGGDPIGYAPIGAIVSWSKNFTSVPALPDNWNECNGQAITHSSSPMSGATLPNLNGGNRFMRGNATTGGTGGASTNNLLHYHTQPTHRHSVSDTGNTGFESSHKHHVGGVTSSESNWVYLEEGPEEILIPAGGHTHTVSLQSAAGNSHNHTFSMSDNSSSDGNENTGNALSSTQENKPPYYNVVWIMRIY